LNQIKQELHNLSSSQPSQSSSIKGKRSRTKKMMMVNEENENPNHQQNQENNQEENHQQFEVDEMINDERGRLEAQKSLLLSTGMYSEEDQIMRDIESKINSMK